MGITVTILAIAILFNFIILRIKWNRKQYPDVAVDIVMLVILNIIFGGTILGATSVTAGSTLISLYLMLKPVKLQPAQVTDKPVLHSIADKIDEILRKGT